jgi:PAS domain S-box-containing protein
MRGTIALITTTSTPTGTPALPGAKALCKSDFSLMNRITKAAANFCISDPHQPDNPIVFASPGFFKMSGYSPTEVVGRNCRVLQGPETSQETVARIRNSFKTPGDIAATILNYRKNGTPFWNQLFIAPLMAADGKTVVHYVGVQREVTVNSIPSSVLARIADSARLDQQSNEDDDDDDDDSVE